MSVTREDVIWAYRMILGREPESESAIQSKINCPDRKALRRLILNSQEFEIKERKLKEIKYGENLSSKYNITERKVIFVHIPKCAGTSVTKYISDNIPGLRFFPERFATLPSWKVENLASYNFFSGHFSFGSAQLVPGYDRFFLSTFRSPKKRLVSFYYFARSHDPDLPTHKSLPTVQMANRYSFSEFLKQEAICQTIAANNPFVRTFLDKDTIDGDVRRLSEAEKTNLLTSNPSLALEIAFRNISSLDAVLLVEELEKGIEKLREKLGFKERRPLGNEQVLDTLTSQGGTLRKVERQPETDELRELIHKNTSIDQILYQRIRDELVSK